MRVGGALTILLKAAYECRPRRLALEAAGPVPWRAASPFRQVCENSCSIERLPLEEFSRDLSQLIVLGGQYLLRVGVGMVEKDFDLLVDIPGLSASLQSRCEV